MPKRAQSKQQLKWAYANEKERGSTGKRAREIVENTKSTKGLPTRVKQKR